MRSGWQARVPRRGSLRGWPLGVRWLVLAAFTSSWNAVEFGGLKLVDCFLAAAFVSVVLYLLVNHEATVARLPRWAMVGGFAIAVVGFIHGTFGGGGSIEFETAARWLVAALLLPWVAVMCDRRKSGVAEVIAKAWALGIGVSSIVATFDKFGLTDINSNLSGAEFFSGSTGREAGLTVHPNHLGMTCALALPLMLFFYQRRSWWMGVLVALVAGEVISGSRASQAAFVIVGLLTVLGPMRTPRITRGVRRAGVALVVAMVALPSVRGQLAPLIRAISGSGTAQSDSARAAHAVDALDLFRQNPVFGHSMKQYTGGHSIPLQLLATGGALLLMAFTFYVVGAILQGRRLAIRHDDAFVKVTVISMVGWFVAGPISNIIADRFVYVAVAVVAVAADRTTRPGHAAEPAPVIADRVPAGVGVTRTSRRR